MYTQSLKKGFTLIELLVVIAIIGILAGIVLVSLGTARNKGKDSAVQEQLSGLRSQMEIFYSTNNTYTNGCTLASNPQAYAILTGAASSTAATAVNNAYATAQVAGVVECHENGNAWAAQAPLTTAGTYWCVDSTGASKSEPAVLGASLAVCS